MITVVVVVFWAMSASVMRRHAHDPEMAGSDEQEPVPSAHVVSDDDTPLGDTREAHYEISPRDLPPDHPGRKAAEVQAGGEQGTTRGDEELLDVGPSRRQRLDEQAGKDESLEGGSPELEHPSHPDYDATVRPRP